MVELRNEVVDVIGIAARLITWKIATKTEMKNILDESRDILDNPESSDWDKAKAAGAVDTISRLLKNRLEELED